MMTPLLFTETNEERCGYQPSEFLANRLSQPSRRRRASLLALVEQRRDVGFRAR
jgi:hypothetical protein